MERIKKEMVEKTWTFFDDLCFLMGLLRVSRLTCASSRKILARIFLAWWRLQTFRRTRTRDSARRQMALRLLKQKL